MYIYIYIYCGRVGFRQRTPGGRLGNPHRAQMSQLELFELIILLEFVRQQIYIEQFEPTASQSTVSYPS